MDRKPSLEQPSLIAVTIALTAAALITTGILTAVTELFYSRGLPLDELAAAERACKEHVYVSEREACVREWMATGDGSKVAHQ